MSKRNQLLCELLRAAQGEQSQNQFARQCGISSSALSRIYAGDYTPTAKTLKKIALKAHNSISYQSLLNASGLGEEQKRESVQAIERALGLSPTFTAEEQAQGAVNSPTVFSDRDLNTIGRINRAEDVLGFSYVDTVLNMLDLAVEEKLKK